MVASAPSAALFFITYDGLKRALDLNVFANQASNAALVHMLSASAGEIAACLVRVPAEVIKLRAQAAQFKSSSQALKYILLNKHGEGVFKGLYRGWGATVFREIPFTVIQFPLYEALKANWARSQDIQKVSPLQGSVCGSVAGGIAAAVTTPLDVIKTRIMLCKEKVSIVQIVKEVAKEEGLRGFTAGIGPRTMWISAGGAIFLGVYETVSTFLTDGKKLA